MITAHQIMYLIEEEGSDFQLDGDQIRLKRGKNLPPPLLEKIKASKEEIVMILNRDQKARESGFLSLHSGEVYERQISQGSHIFIIQDGDIWNVWRESWQTGKPQSISKRQIIECTSFELALFKAKQYLDSVSFN